MEYTKLVDIELLILKEQSSYNIKGVLICEHVYFMKGQLLLILDNQKKCHSQYQ